MEQEAKETTTHLLDRLSDSNREALHPGVAFPSGGLSVEEYDTLAAMIYQAAGDGGVVGDYLLPRRTDITDFIIWGNDGVLDAGPELDPELVTFVLSTGAYLRELFNEEGHRDHELL